MPQRYREVTWDGVLVKQAFEFRDGIADQLDDDGNVVRAGHLSTGRSLGLWGPVGVGKSSIAACVMRTVFEVDPFARGRWEEVHTMLDETRNWQTDEINQRQIGPSVLVWDDLGSERLQPWMIARLDRIVEARTARRRMTVVTTNTNPVDFQADPAMARLWDRWRQTVDWCAVAGTSRRKALA